MFFINTSVIELCQKAEQILCLSIFALRLHGVYLRVARRDPPLQCADWISGMSVNRSRPVIGG